MTAVKLRFKDGDEAQKRMSEAVDHLTSRPKVKTNSRDNYATFRVREFHPEGD